MHIFRRNIFKLKRKRHFVLPALISCVMLFLLVVATLRSQHVASLPIASLFNSLASFIIPTVHAQSCSGLASTRKSPDGNYHVTAFGCVDGWTDPDDNCIPAHPPSSCSGLSGPDCERKIRWFAANTDVFGISKRLKVTNAKTGKSVVVLTLDRGPACSEEIEHGPLIDLSYDAAIYLGNGTGGNYETVKVEEVSDSTPLGPTDGSSATATTATSSTPARKGDVVHTIRVTYGKASKDITITYPVQPEVDLVSTNPSTTTDPFQVSSDHVDAVTWSIKKILNPNKSDAELKNITLPPINNMPFTLTLRPRPGVRDTYIISQAIIKLDPIASPGTNGGTSTGSNSDSNSSIPGDNGNPGATPNTNTCGGKITISNPDGTNFGDPECTFTEDKLAAMLKKEDPDNADYWFTTVIPCESPGYDPNLYYRTGAAGDTPDPSGAWGLFQMGRGLNGKYDHGDVAWPQQIINATTYRRNVSWNYWACAESRWE